LGAAGTKRAEPAGFEIRPIRVIHLEIELVVVDQREKEVARVNPRSAEHAPGTDLRRHSAELVEDEGAKRRAHRHESTSSWGARERHASTMSGLSSRAVTAARRTRMAGKPS